MIGSLAIAGLLSGCTTLEQLPIELPPIELPTELPQIGPIGTRAPSTPTQGTATAQSEETARMEAEVRSQINAIREQQGLRPLSNNERLAGVARSYSRRMAEEGFFGHVSPDGSTLVSRVRGAGIFYFMVGENLFTSTNIPQPASAAVNGWMNSPGHRANVLRSEYRETGIGVWRQGNSYYFTQLFLRAPF